MSGVSIDAIAVLPAVDGLRGSPQDGGWTSGDGPAGAGGLWRELDDGVLLHLGVPVAASDGDLYDVARRWLGATPERIWVFPDTYDADVATAAEARAATAAEGRWVAAGPRRRTLLADLGIAREEEDRFQRDIGSGDPQRVAAAAAWLQERVAAEDPARVEALLAELLDRP